MAQNQELQREFESFHGCVEQVKELETAVVEAAVIKKQSEKRTAASLAAVEEAEMMCYLVNHTPAAETQSTDAPQKSSDEAGLANQGRRGRKKR